LQNRNRKTLSIFRSSVKLTCAERERHAMGAESVSAYNRKCAAERCQERQRYHTHTPWMHGGFATQHNVAAVELAGGGGGTT
jgi:hypothetical protein